MLLGLRGIALIVRTTLPSIGLLILVGSCYLYHRPRNIWSDYSIGFVAIFADSILSPREGAVIPEATSPFMTRSLSTEEAIPENFENRSLISGRRYTASGSRMVVNPPTRLAAMHTTAIQRVYQDNSIVFTDSGLDGRILAFEENNRDYNMSATKYGYQIPNGSSTSAFAGPSASANQGTTVAQIGVIGSMERNLPLPSQSPQKSQQKRSLFKWSKAAPSSTVRTMQISKPVIINNDSSAQPFARIKTIDLTTAANNERERREDAASRARLIPKRPAPPPPSRTIDEALRKSVSVKRKEAPIRRSAVAELPGTAVPRVPVGMANGRTTSASLSPGRENIRQRSPRSMNEFRNTSGENASNLALQRKLTIGLPSNPRLQRMAMTREATIGKGAAEMYSTESKPKSTEEKPDTTYATQLKSSGSILHRPRPYRRDTEKDQAFFPSGTYPHHRRSKSGSPITAARKSIFESHPGSPTQLPYMPAPPPRPSDLTRILSNNNKSMTFHEKIQFLFPTPPLSTLSNSRRSSVPSLPRLPSVYMSDSSPIQSPTDEGQQSSRASKRSRIISFETEDIWGSGAPTKEAFRQNSHNEQSFESSRTHNVRVFTSSEAMPSPRSGITRTVDQSHVARSVAVPDMPTRNAFRPRQVDVSAWSSSHDTRQSFFLDANQALPGDKTPSPRNKPAWHRRIGDELLTFSERRKNSKSRKMPPPTPLLLSWRGSSISVVVHSPAPSPIDSPGKAMKHLQAQLKHFEEPNLECLDASLPQAPAKHPTAVDSVRDGRNSRSRLLQDLEEEMGLQESLWQKMQSNFDCDSNSVMLTSQPPTPSVDDASQEPSQRSPSRRDRARFRESRTRSGASTSSTSSRSSSNSRASAWQQRLTEAQMEYIENAPTLNRNRNLNFLSIAQSQVGSPTPPESVDSETDIETGSESESELSNVEWQPAKVESRKNWLWQSRPTMPESILDGLWDRVIAVSSRTTPLDAPAKDLRPLKRLIQDPLPICSSALWSKSKCSSTGTYIGLWGSRKVRPKSIVVRRASLRPQRKSKRIGYLPDIGMDPFNSISRSR